MSVNTLLTFLIITGLVGIVSWYLIRKEKSNTISGFYFANRNLGFVAVGCSLLFSNINTVSFVGENELVYSNNMSVMAWGMSSVVAMLIVAEFIMPIYLRMGISTTPDYLEKRYDASTKRIVTLLFLANYIVNLLPSILYGGAVAFNGIFRFSEVYNIGYWPSLWLLIWAMGSVGGIYCLLGGLRAIAISDILLGAAMFTGGLLLPWFGLKYLGNGSIHEGLQVVLSTKTEHLNSIGGKADAVPFSTIFTGMLLVNLYYWGTEQYIVQQVLSSRNLQECQKGIALACTGKIISPLLLNIPGLIAVHLFGQLMHPVEAFPRMVQMVASPAFAGFIAALMFGATFACFNAGLNSSSTLFVLNIYKPFLEKSGKLRDEKQLLRVGKKFEFLVCLLAMLIAPFIFLVKNGLYNYLQMIGGLFSVPVFTIILVGFLTRQVPPLAAKIGLCFFMIAYGLSQTIINTGLHFLHVLSLLFVLTCLLMLLIGKIYPQPIPYEPRLHRNIELSPWKNRRIYFSVLILCVIASFILFSKLGLAG